MYVWQLFFSFDKCKYMQLENYSLIDYYLMDYACQTRKAIRHMLVDEEKDLGIWCSVNL